LVIIKDGAVAYINEHLFDLQPKLMAGEGGDAVRLENFKIKISLHLGLHNK
jgi:hypothetical protein